MIIFRRLFLLSLIISSVMSSAQSIINFPDAVLKAKLLEASPVNVTAKNLSGEYCYIDVNHDDEITTSEALQISTLQISQGNIACVEGLQYFINLIELSISSNSLPALDVRMFSKLKRLVCYGNQISSLSYNHDYRLESLVCSSLNLENVDLSGLINLHYLQLYDMSVSSLDLSELQTLIRLNVYKCQLSSLDVSNNGMLNSLDCSQNNLTAIDVSRLPILTELRCNSNKLTHLDLSANGKLTYIDCSDNLLTGINFGSSANSITGITCHHNLLTNFDATIFPKLVGLDCSHNILVRLKVEGLRKLHYVDCDHNNLHELTFADNDTLLQVSCEHNYLESINLCNQPDLRNLWCSFNQLKSINIKNGAKSPYLEFEGNNNITEICADESELALVQARLNTYGYGNCNLTSYCTCNPGGDIFTIVCNQKYDENNNGCDTLDLPMPYMRYAITDGTNTGYLIGDSDGSSSLVVEPGSYTVSPELPFDNQYYYYSPSSDTITFPRPVSQKEMNFCLLPSGVFNDLEVHIMFSQHAIPGFTTGFKVAYRNKGTTIQSDTIFFEYDHLVMQFYNADPPAQFLNDSVLIWLYSDLHPCQSGEVQCMFRLHGPTEIPPLNSGDMLHLKAWINGEPDETPDDNIHEVVQDIVNSFDPNDKTCMEGKFISPEKAGDYVHYLIRFENVGTANAVNVRVTDIIDTTLFVVNSLQPVESSHAFNTSITDNKVEFYFENINLPFEDESNDGYILFKIRTNPSLTKGSVLQNQADIVFDYNFPIQTNTYYTTIGTVGLPEKELSDAFLYPNPAEKQLKLTAGNFNGSQYKIYNNFGVMKSEGIVSEDIIDIADLSSGLYLLELEDTTLKFIVK